VLRINAECLMKCHVELGVFESEIRIGAMMRRVRAAELIIDCFHVDGICVKAVRSKLSWLLTSL